MSAAPDKPRTKDELRALAAKLRRQAAAVGGVNGAIMLVLATEFTLRAETREN